MRLYQFLRVASIAACLAVPARADVTVYYHAGGWDAFDGKSGGGQLLCGIGSHNPVDGRAFSLRFQIGGNDVTFTASKPGWTIPDGTRLPVVMQVGLERPWSEQAVGSGQRVEWSLDRTAMQTFDSQFRQAASMTVTFPSGNEKPWIISLAGSTAASDAMGRCITDLTRRAAAVQSAPTPAPAGQNATQPFGAAGNAAPAQPATPETPATPAAPATPVTQAAPAQPTQPGATH